MSRQELVGSTEYWMVQYAIALYEEVNKWCVGKTHKECADLLRILCPF